MTIQELYDDLTTEERRRLLEAVSNKLAVGVERYGWDCMPLMLRKGLIKLIEAGRVDENIKDQEKEDEKGF